MKILHTADWHLGKRLGGYQRLPEQIEALEELCTFVDAQNIDVVVVAGDLFDVPNPGVDAVEVFYKYAKRLSGNGKRLFVAIAGNHDSPDRIEAPDPLARECGIVLIGYPNKLATPLTLESGIEVHTPAAGLLQIALPNYKYKLNLITTPFANEMRLREAVALDNADHEFREILGNHWAELDAILSANDVNMLTAHLYLVPEGETPTSEPDDERTVLGTAQAIYPSNLPKNIQYAALGHIHKCYSVFKKPYPANYSGSLLPYSFDDNRLHGTFCEVTLEPQKAAQFVNHSFEAGRPLKRLLAKNTNHAIELLEEHINNYVELAVEVDTSLTADDLKQMYSAHPYIVGSIIPIILSMQEGEINSERKNPLELSTEELFLQFYAKSTNGEKPSDSLLTVFRELLENPQNSEIE